LRNREGGSLLGENERGKEGGDGELERRREKIEKGR